MYKKDDNDLEDYLIEEGLKNTIFENTQLSKIAGEQLKQIIYLSKKTLSVSGIIEDCEKLFTRV